jgi:hypothetical protein
MLAAFKAMSASSIAPIRKVLSGMGANRDLTLLGSERFEGRRLTRDKCRHALCCVSIEFRTSATILPKNTGVPDELSYMPALTLSTGNTLQTEAIRCAEYYPCGSLLNKALVNAIWVQREQDFLYIRTARGSAHVCGIGASEDAKALEQAGIRVNRRPPPAALTLLSC